MKLQLVDTKEHIIKIAQGTRIDVYVTFNNCIVAVHNGKFYETRAAVIKEQKNEKPSIKVKPECKPSPNHPWRRYVTAKK